MADDGIKDDVTMVVAGSEVRISTGYEVHQSVLQQPGSFSFTAGQREQITKLIRKETGSGDAESNRRAVGGVFGPGADFKLYVSDKLRMSGKTDGFRATARGGAGTELSIFGRDTLAPLHDAHIHHEISFRDATYKSLVATVLEIVGLDPSKLDATRAGAIADLKLKAGVKVRDLIPAREVKDILKDDGKTSGAVHSVLQTKVGDRWMDFVRKQLDRAGLFLWGGADGKIILSVPSANSAPIYKILRRRGQTRNEVNVTHADLLFDTRPMNTYAVVYGRGNGRKGGRPKAIGESVDDLMYALGFPPSRAISIRDAHCKNQAQAAYLAQRKLAEGRRSGYQLVYTLAGHSTPALGGGRAVWTPDTVVQVEDEEFGIKENMWIDSVTFNRNPSTQTTIRLMRNYDVIFGTPDFDDGTRDGGFDTPHTVSTVEEILEQIRQEAKRGR